MPYQFFKSTCLAGVFGILFLAISNIAAVTVKTINIERNVTTWKTAGFNCNSNSANYWYVFRKEMQPEIKQKVRYCGGSVLYIGKRNGYYLYNQNINTTCDSVIRILKTDTFFVNILPLIAEEKVSSKIFHSRDLYYIDSSKNIFNLKRTILL